MPVGRRSLSTMASLAGVRGANRREVGVEVAEGEWTMAAVVKAARG